MGSEAPSLGALQVRLEVFAHEAGRLLTRGLLKTSKQKAPDLDLAGADQKSRDQPEQVNR